MGPARVVPRANGCPVTDVQHLLHLSYASRGGWPAAGWAWRTQPLMIKAPVPLTHVSAMTRLPRIKTPCIGVCSTGIGDSVCRGCKRFAHEVIAWNGYSEEQKGIVDQRLARFLAQCVSNRVRVTDRSLLSWQLQTQQVRYNPDHDPHCWVFALLKAGAGQIVDPAAFGFEVDLAYRELSLLELREQIDAEFYALSSAHYERYYLMPDLFGREQLG
jgi:predicted Fe-S protein YdhL (DUF1289 family)